MSARNQRIELITRGERRRRWSVEQKREIAAESLEPGVSPITVARRYGISSGLLYTWRRHLLEGSLGVTGQPVAKINARRAQYQLGTRDRIEHPAGNADDDACRSLHLRKLAGCSLLHPPNKNLASKIRVPWIVDFQLLPDMGRMNG